MLTSFGLVGLQVRFLLMLRDQRLEQVAVDPLEAKNLELVLVDPMEARNLELVATGISLLVASYHRLGSH